MSREQSGDRLKVAIGLAAAQVAFGLTFRGPRPRFWQRMTLTGLSLGSYALAVSPESRRLRIRPLDVALGLGSAAALYATFQLGDRFARRFVPGGEAQIRDIYALRSLRPKGEIAARLVAIIGPAEEVFWRGFIQATLARILGRWRGAAAGAAGVAGAHWAALYAMGMPLGALIVSHAAWDVWIFLLQPTIDEGAVGL